MTEIERLTDQLAAAEARADALQAERAVFVDKCRDIRDGSPNQFYAHVDQFCKEHANATIR